MTGDELAPTKVASGLRRNFQYHFDLALAQPDGVLLRQRGVNGLVRGEGLAAHLQTLDLAEGVGHKPGAVARGQVPDAAVVDQFVRLHAHIGFNAFAFMGVGANAPAAHDRFFQAAKAFLPAIERFITVAPHQEGQLQAAVKDVAQEVV